MEIKYADGTNKPNDLDTSSNKYHLRQNKTFILYISLAVLYCIGYFIVLIHEFSRNGTLNMIFHN